MLKFRLYLAMLILPFALAGYLINAGQQGMHEAKDFKQPVKLSMAQFAQQRPKEGWFQLTGAKLDVQGILAEEGKKDPKELFVPLMAANAPAGPTSTIMLRTEDATLRQMLLSDDAAVQRLSTFQGMVQTGVDTKGDEIKEIAKFRGIDRSDLLILDHKRKPREMGSSQAMFAGGIGVAVLAVIGWILFLLMKIARRA